MLLSRVLVGCIITYVIYIYCIYTYVCLYFVALCNIYIYIIQYTHIENLCHISFLRTPHDQTYRNQLGSISPAVLSEARCCLLQRDVEGDRALQSRSTRTQARKESHTRIYVG